MVLLTPEGVSMTRWVCPVDRVGAVPPGHLIEAGQVIEPPALIVICRVTIPTTPVVGIFVKVIVVADATEIVL
jgi:hypothetical protein